ncbi:hypothetical protein CEXT_659001 [Caerostris extrusa]|uniref:Uncharacterized protein n=1 Tax=Caerostris extrusa TaxID=172846 RepID=A0AAV4P5T4_CAEEX|nr:hypothetical protein CEXT_659001 [Caerostris extrusa]
MRKAIKRHSTISHSLYLVVQLDSKRRSQCKVRNRIQKRENMSEYTKKLCLKHCATWNVTLPLHTAFDLKCTISRDQSDS